jgi:hypothetical protein
LSLCTTAHSLYTRFANIFGASFPKRQCDRTLGTAAALSVRAGMARALGPAHATLLPPGAEGGDCWAAWLWAHEAYTSRNFVEAAVERLAVEIGLGRIVALRYCSSTLYQMH